MKKRNLLSLCFLVCLFLTSCTKEVLVDVPPQLEINIQNIFNSPQEGVEVILFTSEDNWLNEKNPIKSSITDRSGTVLFEELEEIDYFFIAKKENLSNIRHVSSIGESLKINTKIVVHTIIE